MTRTTWLALALIATTLVAAIATDYTHSIRRIRAEVASGSTLVDTRHGPVEVAVHGDGPFIIVLHGAGGGQNQGKLIAQMFLPVGFPTIAVSRFGYLRSPLPTDATPHAQAEALADVLNALGADHAAILAMSGGVPPALQFAALYPARTDALVLLSSAPFTPLTAASQDLPMPAWACQALFGTDFPIWAVLHLAPTLLDPIFDVTPALRAKLTPEEADDVAKLIGGFLPVTARTTGLANEGAAIDPSEVYPLNRITAPTLVVHARDDGINPFPIGEYLAAHQNGAIFLPLDGGGHLLLGHRAEVRQAIATVLQEGLSRQSP